VAGETVGGGGALVDVGGGHGGGGVMGVRMGVVCCGVVSVGTGGVLGLGTC
jgi:hypothetical protein